MIVRNLSPGWSAAWPIADLAQATEIPPSAIDPFEFHGCACGVASFKGRPPWERHTAGDELIHVLSGWSRLTIREPAGDTVREIRQGDLIVVPRGCWHRNDAPEGLTVLFMTPSEGTQHSWDDPSTAPSGD
jgi:mannose-6-phosphate isomerase-like protein (cupin superfamily)